MKWKLVCCVILLASLILQAAPVMAEDTEISGTVPLVASDVAASNIGYYSATISWKTNGNATSQVFYDTAYREEIGDYSYHTDVPPTLVSEHSITLTGLSSATTYHYRVRSAIPDTEFIAISGDYTFRTLKPVTPPKPPTADFSAAPTSGYAPLKVKFTERATDEYSWFWDFGDGATSTEQNPSHTYTEAGSYTVTLTVIGAGGSARKTKADYITVIVFPVSPEGVVTEAIVVESEDGIARLEIAEGTGALTDEGEPLEYITVLQVEEPVAPPTDKSIIGIAYDFGPDGATFDPPVTLILNYDPNALPEGVAAEDLVVAYFDTEAGEWVELESVVDPVTNTITAKVSHFTQFAVISPVPAPAAFTLTNLAVVPAEVEEGGTVTVSVAVANTGDLEGGYTVTLLVNSAVEATQDVLLAGGATTSVSFSLTKDAGSYLVEVDGLTDSFEVTAPPIPPEEGIAWWVWIVGGVVIVAIAFVVYLVVRRR